MNPGDEDRLERLKSLENPSVHQKAELKKLNSMKEAKTRTVRFREKRMKKQELVEADTEKLMTIDREDVALKYKLPDGKLVHILRTHSEQSKQMKSKFGLVTSSAMDKKKYYERFNLNENSFQ